ncbi:hypothetical protein GE061_020140 [Apolygus lucorum]|uniref:Macroglobulin domain-containing protein n=1 Tax=Apolygus lucorum TaxID=248454 RepID=A0A8S9WMJ5_APOLU|nr:hypothetical protein GE061_020140 [Apolygus lucorum]
MLTFSQRSMTIFIQTDKPIYIQGETVNIRAIPINTELRPFDNTSNLGTVSLNYQLSNQPRFGNWTIQVVAQKQVEELFFLVEEYYQTRFEVNVTMPAFFFTTEQYVTGMVMANYTSGGPVSGNLTLKASIRPIRGERDFRNTDPSYGYSEVVEKYFTFACASCQVLYTFHVCFDLFVCFFGQDEAVPFWYPASYYYSNSQTIPHLRFFNGVYEFRYPIAELEKHVPTLDGMEVMVTATVGERFLDEVITAYSIARVFNSSVQVNFLGGSPQVFKPAMPLSTYISVSFHDGSPLSPERLLTGQMEVTAEVISRSAGRRTIEPYPLKMSEYTGIWEMKIDLRSQLGPNSLTCCYEAVHNLAPSFICATIASLLHCLSHSLPRSSASQKESLSLGLQYPAAGGINRPELPPGHREHRAKSFNTLRTYFSHLAPSFICATIASLLHCLSHSLPRSSASQKESLSLGLQYPAAGGINRPELPPGHREHRAKSFNTLRTYFSQSA